MDSRLSLQTYPTRRPGPKVPGWRENDFLITRSRIKIIGGFPAYDPNSATLANRHLHLTVFSGDFNRNDTFHNMVKGGTTKIPTT